MLFIIEGGSHSSKEDAVRQQGREDAVHQREPFINKGWGTPFFKGGRSLFIKGGCCSSMGDGGRCSSFEGRHCLSREGGQVGRCGGKEEQ